jgi:precorrin-6x reductase
MFGDGYPLHYNGKVIRLTPQQSALTWTLLKAYPLAVRADALLIRIGSDSESNVIKYRGIKCTTVEADWNKYDRAAGPIRNAQMADMRPDVVLAAPGKVGTANMIEAARTRGLNVVMLERMPVVRTYEKGATSGATPSP